MANVFGVIVGTVLVITLLGALGAGGYFGYQWVMNQMNHWMPEYFGVLEPQVATITAVASMMVLLCAVIIAGGFKWMGRKEKEMQIRSEKAELYERLVLIWGGKLSPQGVDDAAEAELRKLTWLLTLRGSSKVIATVSALQGLERETGVQSQEVRAQMAKLLLAMRRDLGRGGLEPSERELLDVLHAEAPRANSAAAPPVATPQVSLSQGV